jgi:hypothetical protein
MKKMETAESRMNKITLLAALTASLSACGGPSPEDQVREILKTSLLVQVPSSVELREVRQDGVLICGKISHDGSEGRTPFQPFYAMGGGGVAWKLYIITARDYLPGQREHLLFYTERCETKQPK